MNKVLSQAIKKAVSEYSSNNVVNIEDNSQKRPDLFSLSDNTELFQNSRGITIKIHHPDLLISAIGNKSPCFKTNDNHNAKSKVKESINNKISCL